MAASSRHAMLLLVAQTDAVAGPSRRQSGRFGVLSRFRVLTQILVLILRPFLGANT